LLGEDEGLGDAVFCQLFRVDRSNVDGGIGQRLAQLGRRFGADLLPVFRALAALAAEQKGKAHG
jgi:hypothetical protein